MTIIKAQGQILDKVRISLHERIFSYGQLYVALPVLGNVKIQVKTGS